MPPWRLLSHSVILRLVYLFIYFSTCVIWFYLYVFFHLFYTSLEYYGFQLSIFGGFLNVQINGSLHIYLLHAFSWFFFFSLCLFLLSYYNIWVFVWSYFLTYSYHMHAYLFPNERQKGSESRWDVRWEDSRSRRKGNHNEDIVYEKKS